MLNWKKFRPVVLLLAIIISSGLLIGSCIKTQQPSMTNQLQILRGDDDQTDQTDQIDQTAQIVINAQEIAEVGELVRFDLSESTARTFKWLMVPETVDFEVYNNGQYAVFSARKPGTYMFVVGCAYDSTVDIAIHIIIVEGAFVPDIPDIPDDPDIIKPDIGASLDQWGFYWCSINKCPGDEAERLAGSFESVAAQIAAGVLQTADNITEATANANRKALGDSLPNWIPVLQEFQTAMKTLAGQGKLSTPDQHQVLWMEIAKGLRHYATLFKV